MDAQQFQKSHPEIYDYAAERFSAKRVRYPRLPITHILDRWHSSVVALPFVRPERTGTLNATERQESRARDVRLMYAHTPKHGPTRQQRRHAAQKAAKSARA